MITVRVLFHLARADFLERVRRYSFLVMLGLVLWVGSLSASGQFRMRVFPDYLGVINSAWVGTTMAITVTFFLGWFGFYLVKGSVNRDYETGVGQIMATTPLKRPVYTLGKWLSNFAVLGVMILLMLLLGIGMFLWRGTESMDLWAISAPLLFVALPCMALVAALAVLFETVSWLRGGFGNVIYFIGFIVAMVWSLNSVPPGMAPPEYTAWVDFTGWQLIARDIIQAAEAAYPGLQGGFTFSITPLEAPKYFVWNGLNWTAEILTPRIFFLLLGFGIALLAAIPFDRFNPSRPLSVQRKRKNLAPGLPGNGIPAGDPAAAAPISQAAVAHLTPLTARQSRFRFDALFIAEFKLFVKGQRLWWYGMAAGLVVAQLLAEVETARLLLAFAWVWPILILSGLGCRENRHNTQQIVFSAPRPITNQLPAMWLSAVVVLAGLGSGALLRFIIAGEWFSVMGWIVGLLFVPSLALACGVLTGSGKTFEVLFMLWTYGAVQKAPQFDYLGMGPHSPLSIYALLSLALISVAVFARYLQMKKR